MGVGISFWAYFTPDLRQNIDEMVASACRHPITDGGLIMAFKAFGSVVNGLPSSNISSSSWYTIEKLSLIALSSGPSNPQKYLQSRSDVKIPERAMVLRPLLLLQLSIYDHGI